MKRFASHSEEDIIAKRQNLVPTNTVKANKAASNLFRSYLEEKNMETNFEMFDVARLAETLSHFYMDDKRVFCHRFHIFIGSSTKIESSIHLDTIFEACRGIRVHVDISYGRHYHKFCSWRATISTILNNATAQHFPVTTHAADTKQKF
jgi:hypothetical protein